MKADGLPATAMPPSPTWPSACTRRGLLKLAGAAAVSLTAGHGLRRAFGADPVTNEKTEATSPTGRDLGFYVAPRDPKLA